MEKRGKYIVFEGCEGCGKTTQISLFSEHLKRRGIDYQSVAEPGGTDLGREIRTQLLNYERYAASAITKILLFSAARSDLFEKKIIPGLEEGQVIVSDRSYYSTIAYQGAGEGFDIKWIMEMNRTATRGIRPDLTFILDIDPRIGLKKETVSTSFSKEELEYHLRVRQGFLEIVRENPECVVVPYVDGIERMQKSIRKIAHKRLGL